VATGLDARGLPWKQKGEVDDYIQLVGLSGFENAYPYQLSGGMAQRAALARALVNHPKVLLLDEPLGALDAFTRMQMQDEILRIWRERAATMVFVTHDIDEAIYLSDRIVIMTSRPGRVVKVIDIPIDRPRSRNYPEFFRIRSEVLELLHFAHDDSPEYYL
jgi:NitT/TauT family transport system ATP-binding protein/sulfonate transport system ATP-binding protein